MSSASTLELAPGSSPARRGAAPGGGRAAPPLADEEKQAQPPPQLLLQLLREAVAPPYQQPADGAGAAHHASAASAEYGSGSSVIEPMVTAEDERESRCGGAPTPRWDAAHAAVRPRVGSEHLGS